MKDPYIQSLFVVPSRKSSRLKQLEKSKCTCSGKTTKGVLITFPIDTGSPCLSNNCIRVE
jgi:hypothetical protein